MAQPSRTRPGPPPWPPSPRSRSGVATGRNSSGRSTSRWRAAEASEATSEPTQAMPTSASSRAATMPSRAGRALPVPGEEEQPVQRHRDHLEDQQEATSVDAPSRARSRPRSTGARSERVEQALVALGGEGRGPGRARRRAGRRPREARRPPAGAWAAVVPATAKWNSTSAPRTNSASASVSSRDRTSRSRSLRASSQRGAPQAPHATRSSPASSEAAAEHRAAPRARS